MSSINQRGWTPIEDDPRCEEEGYYDQVRIRCDALAKWWSQLQTDGEQRMWARQRDLEDGYAYNGEDAPMRRDYDLGDEGEAEYRAELEQWEAQLQAFNDQRHAIDALENEQMEYCETKLYELGARMMRPYEHWNEDERYMEYMERDR